MPQVIFGIKKTLFHRNRLAVELFDFVLGWGGCGGSGGVFDFHQRFGEVLGVDYERITCTFGLGFVLELACLRVGVDGEEVAAEAEAGEECGQSIFVYFRIGVMVIPSKGS